MVTQITGETVTVAPCTSVTKKFHQKYVVELIPIEHNGLRNTSFVILSQSFAADVSLLEKKIGYLNKYKSIRVFDTTITPMLSLCLRATRRFISLLNNVSLTLAAW